MRAEKNFELQIYSESLSKMDGSLVGALCNECWRNGEKTLLKVIKTSDSFPPPRIVDFELAPKRQHFCVPIMFKTWPGTVKSASEVYSLFFMADLLAYSDFNACSSRHCVLATDFPFLHIKDVFQVKFWEFSLFCRVRSTCSLLISCCQWW